MLVQGLAPGSADKAKQHQITDCEAEIAMAGEAQDPQDPQTSKCNTGNGKIIDEETHENGTFHPYANAHINWPEHTNLEFKTRSPAPSRKGSLANGGIGNDESHHFSLGAQVRRPSTTAPITSEAQELARAEAASWAQMSPLMAATLGPLSVLLGIPTLTQRWHGKVLDPPVLSNGSSNFAELPDPALNLVLAGLSLFCEVMGNTLLILRFSNFHTKVTTWLSYFFWIAKIVFGVANYIEFGIIHPETDTIIYLQGFWVGVCSMAVTIIVIMFLTFNLAFLHRQSEEETERLHRVQREFMAQTTIFFFFLGITALIFSKTEQTTYVYGIYYMVVSTLTIGFGDLVPHTAAMKVLTFPFVIIGITLLALIVTSIVRLLSDRTRRRKIALKKQLKKKAKEKKKMHAGYRSKLTPWAQKKDSMEGPPLRRSLTLQEELRKLRQDDWKRERRANLRSMATGLTVFLIFWFIGALIFNFVEPWGFFLTIGFGDYYPTTEAGVSIFIVYALLAVPTMTIVVETVTTNFTAFTMQRVNQRRNQVYQDKNFQIQSLNSLVRSAKEKTSERIDTDQRSIHLPLHTLTERITESLQQMHQHLSSLLMQKLGPDARNVIAAERDRQIRAESERLQKTMRRGVKYDRDAHHIASHLSDIERLDKDELELLNEYREQYAEILAELQVARDRLLEYEKRFQEDMYKGIDATLNEDIEELTEDQGSARRRRQKARRRSTCSSGFTSDDSQEPESSREMKYRAWNNV